MADRPDPTPTLELPSPLSVRELRICYSGVRRLLQDNPQQPRTIQEDGELVRVAGRILDILDSRSSEDIA